MFEGRIGGHGVGNEWGEGPTSHDKMHGKKVLEGVHLMRENTYSLLSILKELQGCRHKDVPQEAGEQTTRLAGLGFSVWLPSLSYLWDLLGMRIG